MNKVFVTGDTHGGEAQGFFKMKNSKTKHIGEGDVLIIAGDFGVLWKDKPDGTEEYLKKWFLDKKYIICFLDGNHENFKRLNDLKTVNMFGNEVGEYIKGKVYHLKRGRVYNINDKQIFTFGGAYSIDKDRRTPDVSWWKEEIPTQEEWKLGYDNLKKLDNSIDYIITHESPSSIVEQLYTHVLLDSVQVSGELEKIYNENVFKKWYCGHHHKDDIIDNVHLLYRDIVEIL